jgi:hypothetical protein
MKIRTLTNLQYADAMMPAGIYDAIEADLNRWQIEQLPYDRQVDLGYREMRKALRDYQPGNVLIWYRDRYRILTADDYASTVGEEMGNPNSNNRNRNRNQDEMVSEPGKNTFSKLRDDTWGVRCVAATPEELPYEDDIVKVIQADGAVKSVKLGEDVWTGTDDDTGLAVGLYRSAGTRRGKRPA